MDEHVILVAFEVEASSRADALRLLEHRLGDSTLDIRYRPTGAFDQPRVTAWWTAEDDRIDRSDRDSAVFVRKGHQGEASLLLRHEALTDEWNVVTDR